MALFSALTIGCALAGPARASEATPSDRFVEAANRARAGSGLPALSAAPDLAGVALGQAQRMAGHRGIFHNPNLGSEVSGWLVVGENVGVGATPESLHDAFMRSPNHRANILSAEVTQIGVGTVIGDDGRLYVAQVFRLPKAVATTAVEPADEPSASVVDRPVDQPVEVEPVAAAQVAPDPPELLVAAEAPVLETARAVAIVTPATVASDGAPAAAFVATVLAIAVLAAHGLVVTRPARRRPVA